MSGGRTAYRGPHDPQPDGRCRHRWANRVTRIVFCGYPAGRAARDAELRAAVSAAFDEYLWGLSISPQPASGPCEESVRYFRDGLLAQLALRPSGSGPMPACQDDPRCYRNDGHDGPHAYPDGPAGASDE